MDLSINPSPPKPKQPLPPAITTSRNGAGISAGISRPMPAPQWPLPTNPDNAEVNNGFHQQYQPHSARGKAPQRPPRPSNVPSILDGSKVQDHVPSFQYKSTSEKSQGGSQSNEAQQYLEDLTSPNVLSPMTMNSRASTTSSVGSILEFPVPTTKGGTTLGPPPSSRRGPSSYYSMQSFVSPIPEESPRTQTAHSSYASSAAIPPKWQDTHYDSDERPTGFDTDLMEEDELREERGEGIVRSASLGKRAKPTMVTNKSSEKVEQSHGDVLAKTSRLMQAGVIGSTVKTTPQSFQQAVKTANIPPVPTIIRPSQRDTTWPTFGADSPTEGNKEFDDMATSSDSDSTLSPSPHAIEMEKLAPAILPPAARLSPSRSPNRSPFFDGTEKEIQYSRNSAIRRPPRLNMDALRDAEARGSLTSLPDLIRRATKLASMMNEGKRPASRLNHLNDFPSTSGASVGKSEMSEDGREMKSLSGISGMLAAFPPPAHGTPLETPRSGSHWPHYESSTKGLNTPQHDSHPKKAGRRCCGMPLWCFIFLILVLLCLVAAAVVIPLMLVVFKKKPTPVSLSALELCQRDAPCQNGGTSILNGSNCSCICANGFTGSSCEESSNAGCTTVSFTGVSSGQQFKDVTLGDAVAPLIDNAELKYSIPLSYEPILASFNQQNLSCNAQNALLAFAAAAETASSSSSLTATPTPAPSSIATGSGVRPRQTVDSDSSSSTVTATASTSALPTSLLVATGTASLPAPTGSSSVSVAEFALSTETLDFVRVAVLYVLQTRSVSDAAAAQSALRAFISSGELSGWAGAGNVTIGTGRSVDLLQWTVDVGQGPVGGRARGGTRWLRRRNEGRSTTGRLAEKSGKHS